MSQPFVKVDAFSEHVAKGYHGNMHTAEFDIFFSNQTPDFATMAVKADVTEIANGNGYVAGGLDTQNAVSRSGAVTSVTGTDITVTATGDIPTFRYVWVFNKNSTTVTNALVGCWDYGVGGVTLHDTEVFVTDFGAAMFTIGA